MKSKIIVCALLLVGMVQGALYAQNNTGEIRGFLYSAETGEPLLFSNVYLKGTQIGIATDVNGFYSLTKVPAGDYTLMVTSIGFDTVKESITVRGGVITTLNYNLKVGTQEIEAVEVFAEKIDRTKNVNVGVTKVTPRKIKLMPSIGGEPDLAQYLQTLPGVVFTGDQGGQLYIRGGSPVQNLTLLDGMMVYNPFHSIGLFSVFDTDLLRSVDVYTGGFKADYGGRISSVMDIRTRDGNKRKVKGKISANPFTGKLVLEGPIARGATENSGMSFLFSQRTSYLNRTAPLLYSYVNDNGLPYSFSDTYGKVVLQAESGSKASVSAFNFVDNANLDSLNNISWTNRGIGGNFLLLPTSSSSVMTGHLGYSKYDINISQESSSPRYSVVDNFNFNLDFTENIAKNELRYGVSFVANTTDFQGFNNRGQFTPPLRENNTELAAYARYKVAKTRYVLEPSIRFHYYASLNNIRPEPRLGFKYNLTDKVRLKFAGGFFTQNLIATRSDRDVVNLFAGFLSSPRILIDERGNRVRNKLQTARHALFGVEIDLNDYIEIDVEPYVKDFTQLVNVNRDYKIDADYIVETGLAQGVDIQFRYERKTLYVQAGYSIGYVYRDGVTDNTGLIRRYPTNFDRRHNLNFLAARKLGKNNSWELSLRWNLGTGFPFTQTQAFFEEYQFSGNLDQDITTQNGDLGIVYGPLNGGRLPAYHRLDISVKKVIKFKNKTTMEINGGLINTYNRNNIFYVDRVTGLKTYQLPIIPSFGMSWSF